MSTGIVDPLTGRTSVHDRLLSLLMDWTTENAITTAMVQAGLADRRGIVGLAIRIGYTVKCRGVGDPSAYVTEREAAQYVVGFVCHREVRRTIAAHTARAYGISLRQAARDLRSMAMELGRTIEEELRKAGAIETPEAKEPEVQVVH